MYDSLASFEKLTSISQAREIEDELTFLPFFAIPRSLPLANESRKEPHKSSGFFALHRRIRNNVANISPYSTSATLRGAIRVDV